MADSRHLIRQALMAQQAGDIGQLERICTQILSAEPRNLQAKMLLAMANAYQGRSDLATERFRELIRIDPACRPAYNWLSALLRESGQLDEALRMGETAVRLMPHDADALANLGFCLCDLARYADAANVLQRSAKFGPNSAAVHSALAGCFESLGLKMEALSSARRATELSPSIFEQRRLGLLELSQGNLEEAVQCFAAIVREEPHVAEYRVLYSQALKDAGQFEEALNQLDKAEELAPTDPAVFNGRAALYQSVGSFVDARLMFEKALDLDPNSGPAYFGIASSGRLNGADRALIDRMERALESVGISSTDEIYLQYALGKAYDNFGDFARAMSHYDAANRLSKASLFTAKFDADQFDAEIDARLQLFTSSFFGSAKEHGSDSERPLFVLGMMRSGTTLTEQMLTRHPEISGIGEQSFWAYREWKIVDRNTGELNFSKLARAGRQFLELMDRLSPDGRFVIEKNPANYFCLGLLHAAFPKAKILHVRRNPVDTLLSLYMTPIGTPPPFAFDRSDLVTGYRQYQRLMDHWKSVIPSANLYEVEYEELVGGGKKTLFGILEFLGLEWHEACLHPEGNEKSVRTPSFWQVRQPLYTTSVARWKRYEPYLGEFSQLK